MSDDNSSKQTQALRSIAFALSIIAGTLAASQCIMNSRLDRIANAIERAAPAEAKR